MRGERLSGLLRAVSLEYCAITLPPSASSTGHCGRVMMDSVTTGHISRPFSSLLVISHHLIHICIHYPSPSLSLKLQPKTKLCPFCIGPIIILNRMVNAVSVCSVRSWFSFLAHLLEGRARWDLEHSKSGEALLIWGHYLLNWLRTTFSTSTCRGSVNRSKVGLTKTLSDLVSAPEDEFPRGLSDWWRLRNFLGVSFIVFKCKCEPLTPTL